MKVPDRITRREDGVYIWHGKMNEKQKAEIIYYTIRVCAVLGLIVLICGIVMAWQMKQISVLYWVLGFLAVYALITFGVIEGQKRTPIRVSFIYEMNEEIIKTGSLRRLSTFLFKEAEKVIIGENFVELRMKGKAFRIFVDEEDLDFLKDYILARVPKDVTVTNE